MRPTLSLNGQWGLGPESKLTAPNGTGFNYFFAAVNLPHANNPNSRVPHPHGKVVPLNNKAAGEWKNWQDPKQPQERSM